MTSTGVIEKWIENLEDRLERVEEIQKTIRGHLCTLKSLQQQIESIGLESDADWASFCASLEHSEMDQYFNALTHYEVLLERGE